MAIRMHKVQTGASFRLNDLSDEISRRIFGHVLQLSSEQARPELLVTAITRRWREIAIATPWLWKHLRINHDRQISVLEDVILRSKQLPVNIVIRLEAFKYRFHTEYEEALEILARHIVRWKSLTIITTNPVLHHIRNRIQSIPMPALEHFELIQCDSGHVHHLGPFVFNPTVFASLRLERAMMYAADSSFLAGLRSVELVESSLAMLDERKLLSSEYPTKEPRPPSMVSLGRLVVDASNPVRHGPAYSPAFSNLHLISITFARLEAPSMDLVQALSHLYGTALASPVLRTLEIDDIQEHALVMLLAVIRNRQFRTLETLSLTAIDLSGIDTKFMDAFSVVTHLHLARLGPEPILERLEDPRLWPILSCITLDGVVISRPTCAA